MGPDSKKPADVPRSAEELTHDYKRHGTPTLFAAIEMAQDRIIVQCQPKHQSLEWLSFKCGGIRSVSGSCGIRLRRTRRALSRRVPRAC